MVVHCLFEQSGTFKNAFRKLGFDAYDYDIENRFGETDFQMDLFTEITSAYNNEPSIFDNITCDDLILCFFPCIRFSASCLYLISTNMSQFSNYTLEERLEVSKGYEKQQYELYQMICNLFIVVLRKNLRMIVENPATQPHYLSMYFPIKSTIIDNDRRVLGDNFAKPTQYWFINIKPQNNKIKQRFVFGGKPICKMDKGIVRSLITPEYAENFIKKYVLKENLYENNDIASTDKSTHQKT